MVDGPIEDISDLELLVSDKFRVLILRSLKKKRKSMINKKVLAFVLFSFPVFALAEPKIISCEWTDRDGFFERRETFGEWYVTSMIAIPIGMHYLSSEESFKWAQQIKDDTISAIEEERFSSIKEAEARCRSEQSLLQYRFIIDTETLSNSGASNAEFSTKRCGSDRTDTQVASLTATPNFLKFSTPINEKMEFIIDRETLGGGFGSSRDFICSVQDFVQKNKI
jgi:hypothetical protein